MCYAVKKVAANDEKIQVLKEVMTGKARKLHDYEGWCNSYASVDDLRPDNSTQLIIDETIALCLKLNEVA